MDIRHVDANGIRFAYHELGEGPLVLLLHGFPDNAETWAAQMRALTEAGYRAVAPYLRGYSPTEIPDGPFDSATLAGDVRGLITALSPDERAFVVGQDWGGNATHAALTWHPEVIRSAVVLNTAHPVTFLPSVLDPAFVRQGFHLWFFQLEGIAELAVGAEGLPFVDWLWSQWSPNGVDHAHLASVKATLAQPGVIPAALGYYRALIASTRAGELPNAPIAVPTLSIFGSEDLTARYAKFEEEVFTGPYRRLVLAGGGHFLQREQPEEISRLILEWFAAHP